MQIVQTLKTQKINGQTENLKYGSDGAACFDFPSNVEAHWMPVIAEHWVGTEKYSTVLAYEAVIPTGYKFEIPKGYRMDIYPRSGWGFKYNIQLANGTGKIDSDYRGEVQVKLIAFSNKDDLPQITKGTRIAQAELNVVESVKFSYVDSLDETERGENGFGSTGH